MRLTLFTDYSLRVLIFLAAEPGRRATVAEIAQRYGIKNNHLTKVVHHLGQQGWIRTVRGKGGGLTLAGEASAIVIGTVVRQAEGQDLPAECFDPAHNTCPIAGACRLEGVLRRATRAFYAVLDEVTLADLVRNRSALAQVLHLPAAVLRGRPPRRKPAHG